MTGWGHISTIAMFPKAPYDPGRWDFPIPVLTLALPCGRLPGLGEAQVLTHIHPSPWRLPAKGVPLFPGPTCSATPGTTRCPEPLCTIQERAGAQPQSVPRLQHGTPFRGCSHFLMFRPAGLLATQVAPTDTAEPYGSGGFSIRASHGLLPPRAPDMLPVRIGQWTVWGLSPHQIRRLVGCSPNATAQPRLKAGAQRTLEGVGCSRLLGASAAAPPHM